MRVVFMGTPEFAVPILEHLVLNQQQVVAVYTQPDRAGGRGRHPVVSAVKRRALELDLPVVQPRSLKKPDVLAELADWKPDVIAVAAFGQILPPSVLELPAHGCINVHASLLPKFRGASPVTAAVLAGDDFTGVSIMLMDVGVDTGPVLAQAQVAIASQDTTGSLTAKLSLVAAHLLLEVLPRWARGEISPRPQDEGKASYSKMLSKEEGEINWYQPAVTIWRRVRAFQPWPGCYTQWGGRQLKIMEAVPLPAEERVKVGQVVALNKEGVAFGVATGEGILGVSRIQLGGKRAMTAAEFLRGQRQLIGAVLPLS